VAAPPSQKRSLSVSKVLAGSLAAATSAVCGSYFGVLGTVGGAAAGSLVSALSAEAYQRLFEHTGHRLRSPSGGMAPSAPARGTAGAAPVQRAGGGRVVRRMLIGTLVIFALAMGLVSGLEAAKGSPLSGGQHGTSIGRVLHVDLGPAVGGLLGTNPDSDQQAPNNSTENGKRKPGLIGGLISGTGL
jgi:hypothetical protein